MSKWRRLTSPSTTSLKRNGEETVIDYSPKVFSVLEELPTMSDLEHEEWIHREAVVVISRTDIHPCILVTNVQRSGICHSRIFHG